MNLHDKSCMLDAFCYILGVPHLDATAFIGHCGELRGFHSQELIDLALARGYAVTEIQRYPIGVNRETWETVDIFPRICETRFLEHLKLSRGILMGLANGKSHAVAWENQLIINPANGLAFPLLQDGKLVDGSFVPMVLLKVQHV